jgi:hypothetical protein
MLAQLDAARTHQRHQVRLTLDPINLFLGYPGHAVTSRSRLAG